MKLRVASVAVSSSLVASAGLAQAPPRSCVRVEVSSGQESARVSGSPAGVVTNSTIVAGSPRFSATKILDLTFTVLFPPSMEGEHLVELRVFTPDAQLYRSMAMPVARGAMTNATRQVDGYARPLPQKPLTQVSRGRSLFAAASTTFPVGGTDIVSSGLYGRWRVEAYLDGAEQRCAPAGFFVLNP
jgi:hypothetical protein